MHRVLAESLGSTENSPGVDVEDQAAASYRSLGYISTQGFYPQYLLTIGEAVYIVCERN